MKYGVSCKTSLKWTSPPDLLKNFVKAYECYIDSKNFLKVEFFSCNGTEKDSIVQKSLAAATKRQLQFQIAQKSVSGIYHEVNGIFMPNKCFFFCRTLNISDILLMFFLSYRRQKMFFLSKSAFSLRIFDEYLTSSKTL